MKKVMVILTAMMFVFSMSAATFATDQKAATAPATPAETKSAEPAKTEKKVKTKKATGEVVKVDEVEGIIVLKGKKGEVPYLIKDVEWKVYKGAKEVGSGDVVSITYIEQDGKKVAKTIAKKSAAKKAEKTKAAEPTAPAK